MTMKIKKWSWIFIYKYLDGNQSYRLILCVSSILNQTEISCVVSILIWFIALVVFWFATININWINDFWIVIFNTVESESTWTRIYVFLASFNCVYMKLYILNLFNLFIVHLDFSQNLLVYSMISDIFRILPNCWITRDS